MECTIESVDVAQTKFHILVFLAHAFCKRSQFRSSKALMIREHAKYSHSAIGWQMVYELVARGEMKCSLLCRSNPGIRVPRTIMLFAKKKKRFRALKPEKADTTQNYYYYYYIRVKPAVQLFENATHSIWLRFQWFSYDSIHVRIRHTIHTLLYSTYTTWHCTDVSTD